jgi:hypothetical protein
MPLYDGAGNVIGARGYLIQLGDSYYLDSSNALQVSDDPISAYIGGLGGTFSVAGVTYTTPLQGQNSISPAPTELMQRTPTLSECIIADSWFSHPWYCFGQCDSAGTEVKQFRGGYHEYTDVCWLWGFIPYVCTNHSGSNVLYLAGSIFVRGAGGAPVLGAFHPWTGYSNTTKAQFKAYEIPFIGGPQQPPLPTLPLTGACGKDGSAAINSTGATAYADVVEAACFGGGITCTTPSDTLCGVVCVDLMTNPSFCGSCSNACQSGWSCQSGVCIAPPPPPPPPPSPCPSGYTFCDPGCVKAPQVCP